MTLENPTHENHPENHANAATGQNSQPAADLIPATGISKVQHPPSPCSYQITCKTEKDWRDKVKFWAELVGLGFLIAYTVFSGCQAYYARQQAIAANIAAEDATESLNTIKTQFQLDQRPRITIVDYTTTDLQPGKDSPPRIGQPVAVKVHFKNIGKSTALNVAVHRHLLFESKLSEFRIEPADRGQTSEMIDPDHDKMMGVVSVKDTFASESLPIDPRELIPWDGPRIVVFGRIYYEDSFGNAYCTPYATMRLENGAWLTMNNIAGHALSELCPVGKP